jgi:hypothetical protein
MNEARRNRAIRAFVATVYESGGNRPVRYDPRAFAEVIRELASSNAFAREFRFFDTIAGPSCPDFERGMTAAQSAGLISRLNPSFGFFAPNFDPILLDVALGDTEDVRAIREVVKRYLARASDGKAAQVSA